MGIYLYKSYPKISDIRSNKELTFYTDWSILTKNNSDFNSQSHQLHRNLNIYSRPFSACLNKKSDIKQFSKRSKSYGKKGLRRI